MNDSATPESEGAPAPEAAPEKENVSDGASDVAPERIQTSDRRPEETAGGEGPPRPEEAAGVETPQPVAAEAVHPESPPHETDRPTMIVRYGVMGLLGRFVHALDSWRIGQQVVIKSDRGMEIGTILCDWVAGGSPGVPSQVRGEVVRFVTHADGIEERHLHDGEQREFDFCQERIQAHNLPMKLVAVEHLFGGDRILFYFISESRVDFRLLVHDLAQEFQTRIEMRQIGVRDEARLLGDYERCGRPLCCRAWMKDLEPVSMKMARVQKATLDPTKISGRCGRLMCCLRFEQATYQDLVRNLPRKNTVVLTAQGRGKVVGSDVVSQIVAVLLENGTRVNVPVESLLSQEEAAETELAESRPAENGPAEDEPPVNLSPETAPSPPQVETAPASGRPAEAPGQDRRSPRGRRRRRGGRRHGRRPDGGAADARPNASSPTPPGSAPPEGSRGTK